MLPVLILAGGIWAGMARQLEPTYTGFGSYAFVYPHSDQIKADAPDPRTSNPLGSDSTLLGEAVLADLTSVTTQTTLGGTNSGAAPGQAANGSHYAITLPPQTASYVVQTWGKSQAEVLKVVKSVLANAPKRAEQIQTRAGAPERSRYTTFVTSPPQATELPPQSKVKLFLAVMAVGIIAGAALSLLVDRLVARRLEMPKVPRAPRRKRDEPAAEDQDDQTLVSSRRDDKPAVASDNDETMAGRPEDKFAPARVRLPKERDKEKEKKAAPRANGAPVIGASDDTSDDDAPDMYDELLMGRRSRRP
ncbi:hypothetical protein [Luteipulveratus mongoliensis]|uniref:Uncharacterized protein n=1 Tax=Luteipulveratus mongoliensis TaxID=571913 RepID=A0A0K1JGT1_9MICO|nr:hypothetical protein [Luteipulveratus mongoliensis]AKU15927.1 hypothetical protein VV02_08790 [Luteipulveratus mongoliensis]